MNQMWLLQSLYFQITYKSSYHAPHFIKVAQYSFCYFVTVQCNKIRAYSLEYADTYVMKEKNIIGLQKFFALEHLNFLKQNQNKVY